MINRVQKPILDNVLAPPRLFGAEENDFAYDVRCACGCGTRIAVLRLSPLAPPPDWNDHAFFTRPCGLRLEHQWLQNFRPGGRARGEASRAAIVDHVLAQAPNIAKRIAAIGKIRLLEPQAGVRCTKRRIRQSAL